MWQNNKYTFSIIIIVTATIFVSALALYQNAYAHQRQLFTIGNDDYLFVVGSLNEPIFVDDKTGVDLAVVHARIQMIRLILKQMEQNP